MHKDVEPETTTPLHRGLSGRMRHHFTSTTHRNEESVERTDPAQRALELFKKWSISWYYEETSGRTLSTANKINYCKSEYWKLLSDLRLICWRCSGGLGGAEPPPLKKYFKYAHSDGNRTCARRIKNKFSIQGVRYDTTLCDINCGTSIAKLREKNHTVAALGYVEIFRFW